jgi:hypothetical protein
MFRIPHCERKYQNLMFLWPCIIVYEYNENNVTHFSFNLLIIKGLYMFRALLAHPQEVLHKRHLVYCVRVLSVGCYQGWSGTPRSITLVKLYVWSVRTLQLSKRCSAGTTLSIFGQSVLDAAFTWPETCCVSMQLCVSCYPNKFVMKFYAFFYLRRNQAFQRK